MNGSLGSANVFDGVLPPHPLSLNFLTHSQASTGELTQYFSLDGSITRGIYVSVFRPYIRPNGASSGPRTDGIEWFRV